VPVTAKTAMDSQTPASCIDQLRSLEPFTALPYSSLITLDDYCHLRSITAGETVFVEGESDHYHTYLLSGELALNSDFLGRQHNVISGTLEARHPLANSQPRQVTATAVTDCLILQLDNDPLDRLLCWEQLLIYGNIGLTNNAWADKLRPTWELPATSVLQLFQRLERLEVESGDIVINQSDKGEHFYIIESGKALVSREMSEDEGESIELAELEQGDGFGEEALLSDSPRSATVSMTTDGVLRRLSKEQFQNLKNSLPVELKTAREAQSMVENGAKWLDVRYPGEYRANRLPGATNIPLHELRSRINELDKQTHYLCYCYSGRRSAVAALILAERGYLAAAVDEGTDNLHYPG